MPHAAGRDAFWKTPLDQIRSELSADPGGLSTSEAAARLAANGPNLLKPRRERALLLRFLARFGNPLVLLLLVASAIAGATGDLTSCIVITCVVAMSVTLDFVQDARAGRAAERLRQTVALRATVLRDGRPVALASESIVPGDVVLLEPGGLVPADGLILESRDFFVNQSLLTGEAYPVEKRATQTGPGKPGEPGKPGDPGKPGKPGDPGKPGALGDDPAGATNAVFMGTSVISGTARVLVCRTGPRTAVGQIGESLLARPPATAFEVGTRRFGLLILRLAILLVLFVLLVNAFFHRPWLESFLFAVALAVGLTPELLPMVVSVTLSRGAIRLAKERVIVKRLAAVHDLGSMDVLCTDKTGTLTEAKIRLQKHVDPRGRDSAKVLELAFLNSSLETGIKSSMDDAILGHSEVDVSRWRKIDEVPFDFERRRVSVLADDGRERLLVLKGAYEDVLAHCTRYEGDAPGAIEPLDDDARRAIDARFESLSAEGYRVLGVAWKATPPEQSHATIGDEAALVFAGFAAFEDPPKASAAEAVRALAASGVTVKIVTGDHRLVAAHLCGEVALPVTAVLTGDEIAALSDPALAARAETTSLFVQVTPAQKNRVIQAIRSRGHVVGYMGDGINDAPSLHAADVGLSVESAVDVAKEAADLILLDQDLGVVHRGILEGRRTNGNIMKYIMMGTSSNFGNMFSMAGGTLLLPFLPMLPVQILVNNFLYDLSEIPIPLDNVDAGYVAKPRAWDMKLIRNFMLVVGPVSSIFDFLTFFVLLRIFHAGEALFHTGWFVESLATQVLVIFVIRTRGNPLRSRPSGVLAATALAVVALALWLPHTALGGDLGFVPLPGRFVAFVAAMTAFYLVMVEAVKRLFYRRFAR